MRTGVTIQDVTRAADQLLAAGERPTVESVRSQLGTGAPATVNRLLKDYYQTLGGRLTLPPEVAGAAAGLVDSVRRVASTEAKAREDELRSKLDWERSELAAERAVFEQERMQLRDRIVALGADLQQVCEVRTGLERRVAELEHDVLEHTRRVATAEAAASAAVEERRRLEDRHQGELQNLRARWDGNERHFLAQIDEARTHLKQAQSEREKDAGAAVKRIGEVEARLTVAATELADLRGELARREAQLAAQRAANTELTGRIAEYSENHEQERRRVAADREALVEQLKSERARSEELSSVRDQAIKDCALHQGRALALQGQLEELRATMTSERTPPKSKAR